MAQCQSVIALTLHAISSMIFTAPYIYISHKQVKQVA